MTQDQPLHERLVAALRARLEVARALGGETWYPAFYSSMDEWRVRDRRTQEPRAEVVDDDSAERRAQFIVANDPATEIRRVEALLRVVEQVAPKAELRIIDLEGTQALAEKVLTSLDDSDGQAIDVHAAAVVAARTLNLLAEIERLRELIDPPRVIRDLAAGEGIEP